ncbi:MAG: MerR family transcriptional regulator [Rhodospirillales bacterium]
MTDQDTSGPESAKGKSDLAFRTISEVAAELDLPQHVLRFWETKFSQVRPMKRAGGRRYYRPEDMLLLSKIRKLLYDDGYTIKGVQKLLKDPTARLTAADRSEQAQSAVASAADSPNPDLSGLREIIDELTDIRRMLKASDQVD